MDVAPGTIAAWTDLSCPWSHVAVWRLWDARRRLKLGDRVRFDHRVFPLELFNSEPTPHPLIAAQAGVCASLAPRAGWRVWQAPLTEWPVTMLPPMEAVQAAKEQGLAASEQLDRGLRRAFWGESRCISLRHVILEVANECEAIDVAATDRGAGRAAARGDGSPTTGRSPAGTRCAARRSSSWPTARTCRTPASRSAGGRMAPAAGWRSSKPTIRRPSTTWFGGRPRDDPGTRESASASCRPSGSGVRAVLTRNPTRRRDACTSRRSRR